MFFHHLFFAVPFGYEFTSYTVNHCLVKRAELVNTLDVVFHGKLVVYVSLM